MKLITEELTHEIDLRISAIRENMKKEGLEALLVASNANIYYTTGRFFRGFVMIFQDSDPYWFVIKPNVYERQENILMIRKPEDIHDILLEKGLKIPAKIGLEFDVMTYSAISRQMKVFPEAEFHNASGILIKSRMIKTPWEIKKMREDGIHQSEVYRRVSHLYKEDMTDLEFQIEIERVLRLEGCLGVIRTSGNLMDINLGSVIAGDNADNPGPYDFTMGGAGVDPSLPVGANGMIIKRGETIMIDMNGSFNGYQTDMTRVWRLGEIPSLAYKAHECSIRIHRELCKMALPGVPVADIYRKAVEIVEEENLMDYFMGHADHVSFIGHGVGIELNEPPVIMAKSRDILQANMTIALEPKFVIPKVGAVGIENTYRVTESGLESLTVFPEEIQELWT